MLKKLSIAGLVLLASTSIAFADSSDTMSTTDTSTISDTSSPAPDASAATNAAASDTATSEPVKAAVHKKHKKHHHKKRHHKKCHRAAAAAPVAEPAPAEDYKGEVSAAPAAPCPAPACTHSPFMTGPYLGLAAGSRINYTSKGVVYTGAQGQIFGGYSMLWDQFFAALELAVQDSAQVNNYSNALGSAKSSWEYGLSVLPGYMISDNVLGYLRFGVSRARFTTGNTNVTGGQFGLGLQTELCNNWDLRGEYVYGFYNSVSLVGNPKSQTFNLGLVYKFQM